MARYQGDHPGVDVSYHEILRLVVVACTGIFIILAGAQIWIWHREPNGDLAYNDMARG